MDGQKGYHFMKMGTIINSKGWVHKKRERLKNASLDTIYQIEKNFPIFGRGRGLNPSGKIPTFFNSSLIVITVIEARETFKTITKCSPQSFSE